MQDNEAGREISEALKHTVRHVVETMCFSEVAPTEEAWHNADTIVTAVNFYGSRSGRLQLEVSSSAAWSLRDAFLGTAQPAEHEDATAGQVVGELGTIICGRFLSAVDPLSTVTLAAPHRCTSGSNHNETETRRVRQGFLLESGHLTASIEFHSENPE